MGGDALAELEEEVVEEELLVERSKPPPPTQVPLPLLQCLMPLSSMAWPPWPPPPPPPVTSFHNCWSSAGLKPPRDKRSLHFGFITPLNQLQTTNRVEVSTGTLNFHPKCNTTFPKYHNFL